MKATPLLLAALLMAAPALARPEEGYRQPPKVLVDLVDAPLNPLTYLSPSGQQLVLGKRSGLLTLKDLSQPELKLAGLRYNPAAHTPSRKTYLTGLEIQKVADGKRRPVTGFPSGVHLTGLSWSPDGTRLACLDRDQLYVVDLAGASARAIPHLRLNGCYPSQPYAWMSDSRSLVCRAVPQPAPAAPKRPPVPASPVIQEHLGGKAAARTYEDLLQNAYDDQLFGYSMTCQLVLVSLEGQQKVLAEGMIVGADPSPDGRYLLVERLHRPFSYSVPEDRFPRRFEVLERSGTLVRTLADLPLAESVPTDFDAVRTGPRDMDWRDDQPATLAWVEAQDGGDPRQEAPVRDRLYSLAAPFQGKPQELASSELRLRGVTWGDDDLALVTEGWWKNRRTRTWRIHPGHPGSPEKLFDRSSEDRYSDPGSPVTRRTSSGHQVLRQGADHSIFLSGRGASPEGDRPFLDRFSLQTLKATRLWRSEGTHYEALLRLTDDGQTLFTTQESPSEPPNVYLRHLGGECQALTHYPHPAPQLAGVRKELIHYKRSDGVDLTGTLYLPPGYTPEQGPLPVLMWAYPAEYKSASAAGQVHDSPYRFVAPWWGGPVFFALRGYAVLDDPSFPIIGEGQKEPNDTYVEQLVMGARAAVDELARRGVGDPKRCAIGGHSYGAFTTANLLAHSDLFRAGIARSGAYNRTLTPFGFQSEERTFWQAPETYIKMAPFTYADKLKRPLLIIHGQEDDNPGTFPIQSERLFAALKGLGGTARLVMLPKEAHGYQARESVLHVLWEMDRWLDRYVKKAQD